VKSLTKQLVEVKKEKEVEIQQRNEMIAHLKDQLQEMKAKTNMEGKYIKKIAEVAVAQTQKRCTISEKEIRHEIEVESSILLYICDTRTHRHTHTDRAQNFLN